LTSALERRSGRKVRVASLLPSATEIICAVGAEDRLVGRSHECDHPPSVRDRPVLTASRIDPRGSSRDIDAAVRAVIRDALSVYDVNEALLAELRPDVIVTQDLCEVCAVSIDDVRQALMRMVGADARLVSLRPTRLSDVLDDVVRVAEALGLDAGGRRVAAELRGRIDAVAERARAASRRPSVVSIEWIDPIMLGGTWMPELIELAGGEPVGVDAGHAAPTLTPEALRALEPEVVLIKPCGFDLARTLEERQVIETNILSGLPSTTRVYATDGNAYFNRPGPRLVESLEILAACTHPDTFEDFAIHHRPIIERLA
jgi:iron complex transport system substrate-binding protein